ncbi:hypothetical protein TWF225_003959 [Orbilia oligospora]|uniref:Uncharacterized protein n=1 Tax=Orbilia oligospora TaxID=2813651 RepID=A0A7C8K0W7_ORBOL|nr:hypothetical protein TWF751_001165 [Orbilia oligospora]KAF3160180.1 hypothetical protein TWF225_003959 [Orbilia oligospora]KAF3231712.1 hypothetical protein TWF128_004643 [Orbilia oligospora]KAF3236697.1 hypothetical protein TWF217_002492 [Orbilia oligospora]KAF3294310.1 hypothetical protein TWF132_003732 [Orbilia oligospora]
MIIASLIYLHPFPPAVAIDLYYWAMEWGLDSHFNNPLLDHDPAYESPPPPDPPLQGQSFSSVRPEASGLTHSSFYPPCSMYLYETSALIPSEIPRHIYKKNLHV